MHSLGKGGCTYSPSKDTRRDPCTYIDHTNYTVLTCKLRLPLLQLANTDEFTINQIGNVIFQKERGGRWLVHGIGRGSRRSGSGSNSVDLVG